MALFSWLTRDNNDVHGRPVQEDQAKVQAKKILEHVEGRVDHLERRVNYLEDQVQVMRRQRRVAAASLEKVSENLSKDDNR